MIFPYRRFKRCGVGGVGRSDYRSPPKGCLGLGLCSRARAGTWSYWICLPHGARRALWVAAAFREYREGIESVLNCGGDTDTVGAITGALLAINSPIPSEWTQRLCDYPCSQSYLERLANAFRLDFAQKEKLPLFLWVALPLRNLVFFVVVVAHVVGRLIL